MARPAALQRLQAERAIDTRREGPRLPGWPFSSRGIRLLVLALVTLITISFLSRLPAWTLTELRTFDYLSTVDDPTPPEGGPIMLQTILAAWAHGRRTPPLLGVDWPAIWALPLAEVRARLGVAPYVSPFPADLFEQLPAAA